MQLTILSKSFLRMAAAVSLMSVFSSTQCLALDGAWRGELDLNVAKLPLVFNFSETSAGKTDCTLDSPAQGAKGIQAEVTYCDTDSVAVEVKAIGAKYSGRINAGKIEGVFSQMGRSFPLTLSPETPLSERRPQTPHAPFPYTQTDTVFTSSDGTRLAGTLVLPLSAASRKMPAVVMVTGSGAQNRDEEIFEHRPFAVIADMLAREGIASLRYDDRGVGKSEGNFATADIDNFKSDASAALDFIRTFDTIGKAGILGHSEGGTIALMLAAEGRTDFAVSLAGMAVNGKELLLDQNRHALRKTGMSESQTEDVLKVIDFGFRGIAEGKDVSQIDIDGFVSDNGLDISPAMMTSLKQSLKSSAGDYFRKFIALTPSDWLGSIHCPVLALNGSLDTQVRADDNLKAVKDYVKDASVKEYPGLNHLFQHASTGEMSEYGDIAETISPEVLADIAAFINSLK